MVSVEFDGLLGWSEEQWLGSDGQGRYIIIAIKTTQFGVLQVIQEDHPKESGPQTAKCDPSLTMLPKSEQRDVKILCMATWIAVFGDKQNT